MTPGKGKARLGWAGRDGIDRMLGFCSWLFGLLDSWLGFDRSPSHPLLLSLSAWLPGWLRWRAGEGREELVLLPLASASFAPISWRDKRERDREKVKRQKTSFILAGESTEGGGNANNETDEREKELKHMR